MYIDMCLNTSFRGKNSTDKFDIIYEKNLQQGTAQLPRSGHWVFFGYNPPFVRDGVYTAMFTPSTHIHITHVALMRWSFFFPCGHTGRHVLEYIKAHRTILMDRVSITIDLYR